MQGHPEFHNILFIQNLPISIDLNDIYNFISETQGFKEIRQVRERGVAFIEFDSPMQANNAKTKIGDYLRASVGPDVLV